MKKFLFLGCLSLFCMNVADATNGMTAATQQAPAPDDNVLDQHLCETVFAYQAAFKKAENTAQRVFKKKGQEQKAKLNEYIGELPNDGYPWAPHNEMYLQFWSTIEQLKGFIERWKFVFTDLQKLKVNQAESEAKSEAETKAKAQAAILETIKHAIALERQIKVEITDNGTKKTLTEGDVDTLTLQQLVEALQNISEALDSQYTELAEENMKTCSQLRSEVEKHENDANEKLKAFFTFVDNALQAELNPLRETYAGRLTELDNLRKLEKDELNRLRKLEEEQLVLLRELEESERLKKSEGSEGQTPVMTAEQKHLLAELTRFEGVQVEHLADLDQRRLEYLDKLTKSQKQTPLMTAEQKLLLANLIRLKELRPALDTFNQDRKTIQAHMKELSALYTSQIGSFEELNAGQLTSFKNQAEELILEASSFLNSL